MQRYAYVIYVCNIQCMQYRQTHMDMLNRCLCTELYITEWNTSTISVTSSPEFLIYWNRIPSCVMNVPCCTLGWMALHFEPQLVFPASVHIHVIQCLGYIASLPLGVEVMSCLQVVLLCKTFFVFFCCRESLHILSLSCCFPFPNQKSCDLTTHVLEHNEEGETCVFHVAHLNSM